MFPKQAQEFDDYTAEGYNPLWSGVSAGLASLQVPPTNGSPCLAIPEHGSYTGHPLPRIPANNLQLVPKRPGGAAHLHGTPANDDQQGVFTGTAQQLMLPDGLAKTGSRGFGGTGGFSGGSGGGGTHQVIVGAGRCSAFHVVVAAQVHP